MSLKGLFDAAVENKNALAILRKPNSKQIDVYREYSVNKSDFIYTSFDGKIQLAFEFSESIAKEDNVEAFDILYSQETEDPKNRYISLLNEALSLMADNGIVKAVFSRKRSLEYSGHIITAFQLLEQAFPLACVCLMMHQQRGIWLTATPERLATYRNGKLYSMALAGTFQGSEPTWTQKELTEHAYVVDHISSIFKNGKIFNFCVSETKSMQYGSLWHLQTDIEASCDYQEAIKLAKELHPTPAVAGLPIYDSVKLINEKEAYDRKFYTGYFGTVEADELDLYVNLRTVQFDLISSTATFYAGGGIVAASNAALEYAETENKMLSLIKVLNKVS